MDISYSSSGNDGLLMSVSPQPDSRMIEVRPYDGANYVRFSSLLDEGFDEDTEGMENQCSKSETEALDMANSLLEDCGIDYTPKTISGLIWLYSTYEGGKTIASEVDGYKITYRNTINGESIYSKYLGEVDNIQNGDTLWDSTITDICELYINDKGVIYADIEEPVTQKEVLQEDVELLSFDEILEIAKSELGNYYSEYPTRSGEITFNSLELTYFYLQDKENENVYIATPVWIFSQVLDVEASDELSYPQQIFIINAMDGSIVYLQDER
jgi:hypothetical protein